MLRTAFLLAGILALAVTGCGRLTPDSNSRGIGPADRDGERDRGGQGHRYALLVGVKDYDHAKLPPLKYTENDVEELAKVLTADADFSHVLVLTTTRGQKDAAARPTAANFRKQLKTILHRANRHDCVVIGLAGHGLQIPVIDPGTKAERAESFFLPADARPRDIKDLAELARTMIPLGELFKQLEESGAGVRLMLVDACRNEPRLGRNVGPDSLPRPARGTAALFSCKGGEQAFESPKLSHGVFFYHVIEGLKGKAKNDKGEVSWSRLAEYVVEQVGADVPKLIGGGAKQTPHEIKNLEGPPPVLVAARRKNEPPAPASEKPLFDRELLRNPGCDEPAIGGNIPGWETVQGSWRPGGGGQKAAAPQAGPAFFHPNSPEARLRQDVDLRGYAALIDAGRLTGEFVGYVRSAKQKPSDTTRIVLEYRDDNETVLGERFDSGALASHGGWKRISDSRAIPKGTRWVRVQLHSVRHGKGTKSNDANYDSLSFKVKQKD